MATADEVFRQATDAIFDIMGKTVVYTPTADPFGAKSIPADWSFGENLTDAGSSREAKALVRIKAADVSMPRVYDKIEIGGVTWTVERIVKGDGYSWELECRNDLRPTFKR
ncbi:MAG TPA: hypothetical protein DCE18_00180 [Syntrophobacteraceae bacterium]|jgi:hypothetical protein|nr:hypothetical protein [Syntrophobacteraceae bacterium]